MSPRREKSLAPNWSEKEHSKAHCAIGDFDSSETRKGGGCQSTGPDALEGLVLFAREEERSDVFEEARLVAAVAGSWR